MKKKLYVLVVFAIIVCALIFRAFMPERVISTAICLAEEGNFNNVKTVYLTFDDGPSDRVTPLVLDALKRNNVKATFFIIGLQAETRPYLIEREINEGHSVAVHSYTHDYKTIYKSCNSLERDVEKCNDVIENICGKRSKLYRFPGGSYNVSQLLKNKIKELGYKYVDWNASTGDAEIINPTPQQLYKTAIKTTKKTGNVILLCHDGTTRTTTALALDSIIKYYKQNGYLFDTL